MLELVVQTRCLQQLRDLINVDFFGLRTDQFEAQPVRLEKSQEIQEQCVEKRDLHQKTTYGRQNNVNTQSTHTHTRQKLHNMTVLAESLALKTKLKETEGLLIKSKGQDLPFQVHFNLRVKVGAAEPIKPQ